MSHSNVIIMDSSQSPKKIMRLRYFHLYLYRLSLVVALLYKLEVELELIVDLVYKLELVVELA